MELIDLEEFKTHARIDFDDEDDAAQQMVEAANEYVTGMLDIHEGEPYSAPADVRQATLMIAAHWWEQRETAVPGSLHDIPIDAQEILINHRGWAF